MENLNNVPSTGTFGGSINQVNQNFGLVKDAIEGLEGRTIRSKGLFPTQAALIAAYPSPKVGDYAYVGSSLPATIYDCEVEGTWHNTQQQGGSESVPLNDYPTKSEMNAAIAAETARNGYYQCTVSDTTLAVSAPGFTLPAHGGNIRIKMSAPATGACTLNINSTGPKPLLYNGLAVSSANTWERDEIISVFYDPSGSGQYLASNSQGGGGKASKIKYDNSQSGLASENVQEALDEVSQNIAGLDSVFGEAVATKQVDTNKAPSISKGILPDGTWTTMGTGYYSKLIRVEPSKGYLLSAVNGKCTYAFLASSDTQSDSAVFADIQSGLNFIRQGNKKFIQIPSSSNAYWLYVRADTASGGTIVPIISESLLSDLDKIKNAVSYDSSYKKMTISVSNSTGGKNNTPCGFETGKRYKIRALSSAVYDSDVNFYLKNIPTTASADGFNLGITIAAGKPTSDWVEYNPLKDIYQYISSYQNGKRTCTYNIEIVEISIDEDVAKKTNGFYRLADTVTQSDFNISDYVNAGIVNGNPTYYSVGYAYRVCLVLPLLPFLELHFVASYGYKVAVQEWNVTDTNKSISDISTANGDLFIAASPWNIEEIDYDNFNENTNKVIICIAKTNDAAITPSEASANVTFTAKGKYVSSENKETSYVNNVKGTLIQQTYKYNNNLITPNNPLSTQGLLTLIHFSDVHGSSEKIARIVDFKNKYSAYINDIIHTGDSVKTYISDADPFALVNGAENILNVNGNHESWLATASDYHPDYDATEAQCYAKMFAPYISNWGLANTTQDKCYYYKDYTTQKIRLIVLDSVHWHAYIGTGTSAYDVIRRNNAANEDASAQKTWFQNALASVPSGYSVICAMHYPPENGINVLHGTGFSFYTTLDTGVDPAPNDPWKARNEIYDCVDTFINGGGKFICWLSGHTHRDICGLVAGHTNQFFIGITTARYCGVDAANITDTPVQDAFNVFTADVNIGCVKLLRIGQTVDNYMQSKETLCYDYLNKVLVYHT